MIDVCDTSPGTVLRTHETQRECLVKAEDRDHVTLATPDGRVTVEREELQADIACGDVEVIS